MTRDKWIIWDFNGTLLDDVDLCVTTFNSMLLKRSLPVITRKQYMERFSFPVKEFYRELGFDFTQSPFDALALEYMNTYLPASLKVGLREGALTALRRCRDAGCRQAMLSASDLDSLKRQLTNYGIASYFDEILGLSHIRGTGKTGVARRWIRQVLQDENRQIQSSRIAVIGDTVHDSEVAQAMTEAFEPADSNPVLCVLLEGGHNDRVRLEQTGAQMADSITDAVDKALYVITKI